MEITTSDELQLAIHNLKVKAEDQKYILRTNFNEFIESLKPANLIRSAVSNITHDHDLIKSGIGTSVSMGAGMLSKKLIVGKSHNLFKRFLGTMAELVVARGISNNSDIIAKKGISILKKMANKE